MAYLGMDFGNSNSAIAWWHDGRAEVIKGSNDLELFPSLVYYNGYKSICGPAARDNLVAAQRGDIDFESASRRTYCDAKRYLGQNYIQCIPLKGNAKINVTPREAAATIMKSLKVLAENNAFGVSVTQLVLTHPVAFTEAQRADLQQAAQDAGFNEVVLLAEPEAAALAYVDKYKASCTGIIVLDIGAGSTDLCYMRNDNGNFVIDKRVPSDGATDLGGMDFDQCLYDYWNQEATRRGAPLCADPCDINQRAFWKCCEVKERLSGELGHDPVLRVEGNSCTISLSRDRFESIIREKVKALRAYLNNMVSAVSVANLPLDTVLLVGGSSRIPCIERECQRVVPERVKLVCSNSSTTLVALGAALHGAKLSGEFTTGSSAVSLSGECLSQVPRKAGECLSLTLAGDVAMEFVWCPPGRFIMGSLGGFLGIGGERGRFFDEVQHEVTLSQGFWMARCPTTQLQYKALIGNDPSHFKGDARPVEQVNWDEAVAFCEHVNEHLGSALPEGFRCALPTEAQWEYACRAGTTSALNSGQELTSSGGICPNLDVVAWYDENSGKETHAVAEKQANAWGLFDMHGNVQEWCRDWRRGYPACSVTDPTSLDNGSERIVRGGACARTARWCRSAFRYSFVPSERDNTVGFRPVLVPSVHDLA